MLLHMSEPRRSDGPKEPKSREHKQQQQTKDPSILTPPQNQKIKDNSWESAVERSPYLWREGPVFLWLPQQRCFLVKFTLNQAGPQRRKRWEEAEHKARQERASRRVSSV